MSAGLPVITWVIYTPLSTGRSKDSARRDSRLAALIPSHGGLITTFSLSLVSKVANVFAGTANPIDPRPKLRGVICWKET